MTEEEYVLALANLKLKRNQMNSGEFHQKLAKLVHKYADSLNEKKSPISLKEIKNSTTTYGFSRVKSK